MSENKKRRNKAYYCQKKKSKNDYEIDVGMKGFLITCNNNEAKAVVEAYKLLNEYADKLFGPSNLEDKESNRNVSGEEDIEAELKKHVEGFKNQPMKERRFQNVNTKVKSVVFIKTTLEDPVKLVEHIFKDTLESGLAHSRFILRLVPVLGTCRAEEDKLTQLCQDHFEKYLQGHPCGEELTYSTLYKIRCNNVINRDIIYTCVNKALKGLKPTAKVDYDNPDIVINVNVMPKICCLSILEDYNKYKKYNLNEILNPTVTEASKQQSCSQVIASQASDSSKDASNVVTQPSTIDVETPISNVITQEGSDISKDNLNNSELNAKGGLKDSSELINSESSDMNNIKEDMQTSIVSPEASKGDC